MSYRLSSSHIRGCGLLRKCSCISPSDLMLYSCSTVYTSIHAEYLLNGLHSTGGRRVEWLNRGAPECDGWVRSWFCTREPVMLVRHVNEGL